MNSFDAAIIQFLAGISRTSPDLNSFMYLIVGNELLKGGFVVSVFWFLWFKKSNQAEYKRQKIILGMISCILAVFISRLLTKVLPYRPRPIVNDAIASLFPDESLTFGLNFDTSLPSDHAVLFFALATGIYLVSKKPGIFAYLYVFFIICFPRIYLGFHYPTDILLGAAIGGVISLAFSPIRIWRPVSMSILQFSQKRPGLFYCLFFLLSFEIGTLFISFRSIVHYFYSGVYSVLP